MSGDGIPQCDCPTGTGGRLCQEDTLNECETEDNPCSKGFCIDGLRSYNCNCPRWVVILIPLNFIIILYLDSKKII